jgi:fatty acid desaturase
MTTWKQHSGFVAWPTLVLAAGVWVTFPAVWWAVDTALLPRWIGAFTMMLVIYAAFTPMHEAAHGNVGGRRDRAWLDTAVGWGCSLLFLAPFPTFKAVHLRHHGTVNRDGRDPDLWVAGPTWWSTVGRCLTIVPHYYRLFLGPMAAESPALRQARNVAVVALVGLFTLFGALVVTGQGLNLLTLWILPAWLASGLLAFAFDWLPHHPHRSTDRFTNARIVLGGRLLTWALLWQNYHLIHHLWPRVPFYRYDVVFDAERGALLAKGIPVEGRGSAEARS